MSEQTRFEVALHVSHAVARDTLTIDYEFANRSDRTLFVFDIVASFGEHGKVVVEPKSAFVLIGGTDTVRIVRALMPNPPLKSIAKRPPNLATRVAPRSSHKAQIVLPLPLVERHPFYAQVGADAGTPVQVRQAVLEIGWVEERPGMAVSEFEASNGSYLQVAGGWGKPVQYLAAQSFAVAVPVVRHPDPFARPRILQ